MEIHLKIIGILLITLALIHLPFPKYFNWKKELSTLQLINRQMMLVHTFFIALVVLMMGTFCFFYASEILKSPLGHIVGFGFCIFWFIRLVFQLFIYSPSLWKGKKFETIIHIVFSFTWSYFTIVFFLVWRQ